MKESWVRERMELLTCGEALGYPRIGFQVRGKKQRIAAGEHEWERFARVASLDRLAPSLRIAKVLRDQKVAKFHPPTGADLQRMFVDGESVLVSSKVDMTTGEVTIVGSALVDDIEPAKPLTKEERSARNKAAWAQGRAARAAARRTEAGEGSGRPAQQRAKPARSAEGG